MKKIIYSIIVVIGMIPAIASANGIECNEAEVQNLNHNIDVVNDNVGTGCSGNVLILDRRGNVVRNIPFSSNAQNLRDCIASYDLAVMKVTEILEQGQTTGGEVGYN